MKKSFSLLTFLVIATFSFAQIGFKAGANLSFLDAEGEDFENVESKLNYQGGLMLNLPFNDNFSLRPEAVYIRKGADYRFLATDVSYKMDYLEIPVLAVVKFGKLPLSIHVGPQFSYLLSTTVSYENSLFGGEKVIEEDKENFEDFDYGFAAGAGLHFGKAMIELRYSRGLKDFEKSNDIGGVQLEPSSKHFNLQASVGVFF